MLITGDSTETHRPGVPKHQTATAQGSGSGTPHSYPKETHRPGAASTVHKHQTATAQRCGTPHSDSTEAGTSTGSNISVPGTSTCDGGWKRKAKASALNSTSRPSTSVYHLKRHASTTNKDSYETLLNTEILRIKTETEKVEIEKTVMKAKLEKQQLQGQLLRAQLQREEQAQYKQSLEILVLEQKLNIQSVVAIPPTASLSN